MTENSGKQTNTWGMLCHLTSLSAYVGIPFGHIVGPLVIWLIKKDESEFVEHQGKESLNFQISIAIYAIIAGLLILIVIGIFLLIAVGIFSLVMIIIATVKASNGEKYRYPLTLRLIQ